MTPARPRVSVITANYNGARHLPAAIASVLGQTLAELELIVVDDGSSDDSPALVREAAARDPRVRLVEQANAGPGAARNRGMAEARGEWLAVFDSDDLMAPDRLARLLARADADGAEIVADNLLAFEDGSEPEAGKPFLSGEAFARPRWISLGEVIGSSRMYAKTPGLGYLKPMVRAEALRAAGVRYDPALRIGEDYDLLLRLLASGLRLRLEPEAMYLYRRHSASISHALRRDHIEAMLRADAAFDADTPDMPADARRAQAARRRSLERALAYDDIIQRLKRRDLAGGVVKALAAPDVWPLLTMPVQARLKRLTARRPAQHQPA